MEVRGSMRRWWKRKQSPKSKSPRVKGSEGPRYLKVTFKYKLDSKEGPSCFEFKKKVKNIKFKLIDNEIYFTYYC